jgi:hypothetical protein
MIRKNYVQNKVQTYELGNFNHLNPIGNYVQNIQ